MDNNNFNNGFSIESQNDSLKMNEGDFNTSSEHRMMVSHQWQPYTGQYNDNAQYNYPKEPVKVKDEKKKKEKKPLTFKKLFATCVAFMMITIVANSAIIYYAYNSLEEKYMTKSQYANENIKSTSDVFSSIVTQTGSNLSVAQIAKVAMPSVVAITSTSIIEQSGGLFWGFGGSYQVQGAGSGIIVGKNETELLVATNNHVVEGTTSLTVQFTNDVSVEKAYVKGTSADNDIAVVAIPLEAVDADTIGYISIATLGDSDSMNVGDGVIAIGNALGYGQSLTVGYVSAKNREITTENTTLNVIQTDAAINGGNSGGALLNMKGEVIGINVAKSSSSGYSSASVEGMGYAIPISEAKEIIQELSNKVTRYPVAEEDRGYLGVKVMTSDKSAYEYYNIPEGAYIREILKGGAAEKAGFNAGDVIVAVDGTKVSTADDLIELLETYSADEKAVITVMVKEGSEYVKKDIEVTLVGNDKVS